MSIMKLGSPGARRHREPSGERPAPHRVDSGSTFSPILPPRTTRNATAPLDSPCLDSPCPDSPCPDSTSRAGRPISPAPWPWPSVSLGRDHEPSEPSVLGRSFPPTASCSATPALAALAAILFAGEVVSADPPPCPPLVDVPCEHLGGDDGDPPIAEPCVPGPGGWIRTPVEAICMPEQPIDLREQFSFGLTRWHSAVQAAARPTVANCMVSLSGQSIFLGVGSRSLATSASFQRTARELWSGDGPAAPRLVQLVANGFAGLSIAVTCGPSQGCSATASAAAAGGCQSLGDASAVLEPTSIGGTAHYDSVQSAFRIEGDLGAIVDDSGPSMTGDVSSEIAWTLQGIGAASGSASYVVRPDRTHCAYTNRPIVRRGYAAMSAAVAVTVDAGAAAAVGIATAGFDVN